jgi:hypothetical protein
VDLLILKQLYDLARDNWDITKNCFAALGALATIVGGLRGLVLASNRYHERLERRRTAKAVRRKMERQLACDRSAWYTHAFAELAYKRSMGDKFDRLTVQQACAYLGEPFPDWAVDGWERVYVSDLNKRVEK